MKDQGDIRKLIEPSHHRAEIIFGLAAFSFAVFLGSQIGSQAQWAAGKSWLQQPSLFAIVSIVGMVIFGALELFFAWRRNARGRGDSIAGEVGYWLKAIEYILWFMAYVLSVPIIGYLPATLLFCVVLTYRLGYRSGRVLLAAAGTGLATVVIFKSLLSAKIPGGAIYDYLPAAVRNFMILYL
jgi:hypothetical protein